MSTQYIDFETASDTGQNDAASIKPFSNGEAGSAAVFNRPPENLRVRTETLKSEIEKLKYLSDADRQLLLSSDGDVTWNGVGTGTFTLSSGTSLVIKPFLGPAVSTPAKVVVALEGTKTLTFSTRVTGATGRPRAYNGANELSVLFKPVDGGVLSSVITGAPANKLEITYNSNAVSGTTSDDLQVYFSSGAGLTNLNTLGLTVAFSTTDTTVITPPSTELRLSGAADAEKHVISDAALTSFFSNVSNKLTEGDVLCIRYDDQVLVTGGGRRQSIDEAPENVPPLDGATVSASSLFLLRLYPERLPGAIPVATVQNGQLIFLNNRVYGVGESGPVTASGSSYQGSGNDFANSTGLPAGSFEAALDTLVTYLGSKVSTGGTYSGADRVGVQAIGSGPITTAAGKLSDALTTVVSGANAHINNATGAHAASAISTTDGPVTSANDAQTYLNALDTALDAHVTDAIGAHAGSAISAPAVVSTPNSLSAITVTGQLSELLSAHNAHRNNATGAHASTAISTPAVAGMPDSLATITVGGQLSELLTKHNNHLNDTTAAHKAINLEATNNQGLSGLPTFTTIQAYLDRLIDYANNAAKQNVLINSSFHTWQRGTSFSLSTSAPNTFTPRTYTADRWYAAIKGTGGAGSVTLNITRDDAPLTPTSEYGVYFNGGVSSGTGTFVYVQELPPEEVRRLRGKTVVLSHWMYGVDMDTTPSVQWSVDYSTTPGDHYTNGTFLNIDSDGGTPPMDTLERFSMSFLIPVDAECLAVVFTWSASGQFHLGEVMLSERETGFVDTWRPHGGSIFADQQACQRYYQKSYELNTAPGTDTYLGVHQTNSVRQGFDAGTFVQLGSVPRFTCPMYKTPTVKVYSKNGTVNNWTYYMAISGSSLNIQLNVINPSTNGFQVSSASTVSLTEPLVIYGHWTADAEI